MDRQPPHSDSGNQKRDDSRDALQRTIRRTPSPEDKTLQQRSSTKRKRQELHRNDDTDGSKQNTKAKIIDSDNSSNTRVTTTCAPDSSQEQATTESYVTADNRTPGSFAFNSTTAEQKVALSSSNNIAAVLLENQPECDRVNPSLLYNLQAAASLQQMGGSTSSELPQQKHQQFHADQKNSLLTSDKAPLEARTAGTGPLGLDGGGYEYLVEGAGPQARLVTTSTKAGPQQDDTSISANVGKVSTTINTNNGGDSSSSSQHHARTTTTSDGTTSTTTATSDTLTNMQQLPQPLLLLQQQQQQQQEQLVRMLGMMINPTATTNSTIPRNSLVSNNNIDSSGNDTFRHLVHHQPTSLHTTAAQRISSSSATTNLLDHSDPLLLQLLQTTSSPTTANNLNNFSSAVPASPQTGTATSNNMLLPETLLQQATSSGNSTVAAAADQGVISSNFVDNMMSSSGDQQGMLATPTNFTNAPFSSSSDTGRMSFNDALLLQRSLQHSLAMQQLQQDQYELQYRMLLLSRSNIDTASFAGAHHGILEAAAGLRASEMAGRGAVIAPSSQQSELMNLLSSGELQGNINILGGGGNVGLGGGLDLVSLRIGSSNTMASATTNTNLTGAATTGTSPNTISLSTATSGNDLRNDNLNTIGGLLGGLPTAGLATFAAAYAAAGSTSSGDLPPAPPSQNNAIFNSTTNRQIAPDGFPVDLPTPLALPEDLVRLSAHQVFLRQQIEAFRATEDDASTHTRGRNKPIQLGQVGIRCRYCAHIPVDKRQKGSTYFPATVLGIYQAAQNMCTTHLQCGLCSEMPESVKQEFSHLLSTKSSSSGAGRPYWGSAAESLGLVNTENDGIRFVRDSFPASSGGEPPRTSSVGSNSSQQQKQALEEGESKSD